MAAIAFVVMIGVLMIAVVGRVLADSVPDDVVCLGTPKERPPMPEPVDDDAVEVKPVVTLGAEGVVA